MKVLKCRNSFYVLFEHIPEYHIIVAMSNLNMEFGFNVPKNVIYEALTHPLYTS